MLQLALQNLRVVPTPTGVATAYANRPLVLAPVRRVLSSSVSCTGYSSKARANLAGVKRGAIYDNLSDYEQPAPGPPGTQTYPTPSGVEPAADDAQIYPAAGGQPEAMPFDAPNAGASDAQARPPIDDGWDIPYTQSGGAWSRNGTTDWGEIDSVRDWGGWPPASVVGGPSYQSSASPSVPQPSPPAAGYEGPGSSYTAPGTNGSNGRGFTYTSDTPAGTDAGGAYSYSSVYDPVTSELLDPAVDTYATASAPFDEQDLRDRVFTDGSSAGVSGAAAGTSSSSYGERYPPPSGAYPPVSDITILSQREAETVLPLAPSIPQLQFYQPKSLQERIVQVMGSLGASVVLSKYALLAGPVLCYPVWAPYIWSGIRNLELYAKQFRYVGLWRLQVLEVEYIRAPFTVYSRSASNETVRLTVGDGWAGGARAELVFPAQPGTRSFDAGEPAELLVLSNEQSFGSFKVVRELYLPRVGLWLSEYPFIRRETFLSVSLDIERSRSWAYDDLGAPGGAAGPDGAEYPPRGPDVTADPASVSGYGGAYPAGASAAGYGNGARQGGRGGEPFAGEAGWPYGAVNDGWSPPPYVGVEPVGEDGWQQDGKQVSGSSAADSRAAAAAGRTSYSEG